MSPQSAMMSPVMSAASAAEVLAPALSKGQARSLESQARRHWRSATRNALIFAAELRRLHDGGAHLVRGYDNFAVYASQTFDGLTASAAKQLSRQGGVLLCLERHGRIRLDDGRALPVATTALRALSVVQNNFGEGTMLAVYDRAIELRPGRAIVQHTVKAAAAELLPPAPAAAVLPAAGRVEDQADDELEDEREELPEEVLELIDRLDVLRGHIDDLRLAISDPILARRELSNIEEEVGEVRAALANAYDADHR